MNHKIMIHKTIKSLGLICNESIGYSGNELRTSINGNINDFGRMTPFGFFGEVNRSHLSESSSRSLQTKLTVAAVINETNSVIPLTSSSVHFLANLLLMHFVILKNSLKKKIKFQLNCC